MKKSLPFKIIQLGFKKNFFHDFYYKMLKISWINFIFASALSYLLLNLIFAMIYLFSPAEILNARPESLWDSFIFSFQTSSTLGYGKLLPKTDITHAIVILDTLMGIFYVAIVTGMAFAKFARPSAKIIFSNNIILSTFDGIPTLMFRLGNARDTHIINASLNVAVLIPHITKEGQTMSRFYNLDLMSNNLPTFSLSWTAMHQINQTSPLHGMNINQFKEKNILVFVSFTGIDDVLSQTVTSSYRYMNDQIIKAKHFSDIMHSNSDQNSYTIDFSKFHLYEE